jgi:hypothetical protein
MGLFHRRREVVAPPGQVWTACPPGLERNARKTNLIAPLTEELAIVLIDDEYFKAHGTLPPLVDPEATADNIKARIDSTRILAEQTQDMNDANRYLNEIGYLQDKLNRGL